MLHRASAQTDSVCEPSSEEDEDKTLSRRARLCLHVWNPSQSMWICLCAYTEITSNHVAIPMAKNFHCDE